MTDSSPEAPLIEDPDNPEAVNDGRNELDYLVGPPPETRKLASGFEVKYLDLKTLQLFALMRIVTRGAGPLVNQISIDIDAPKEQFVMQFMTVVFGAVPEADQETIQFLLGMVEPADLIKGRSLDKQAKAHNEQQWDLLSENLSNPELSDLLDLLEDIIKREGADLQALGKRVLAMFEMARRTGQPLPANLRSSASSD